MVNYADWRKDLQEIFSMAQGVPSRMDLIGRLKRSLALLSYPPVRAGSPPEISLSSDHEPPPAPLRRRPTPYFDAAPLLDTLMGDRRPRSSDTSRHPYRQEEKRSRTHTTNPSNSQGTHREWRERQVTPPVRHVDSITPTPAPVHQIEDTPQAPLGRNLDLCDFPSPPARPQTRDEVMNDLHKAARQYANCEDPVESNARRARILLSEQNGDVEAAADSIMLAASTALAAGASNSQFLRMETTKNLQLPSEHLFTDSPAAVQRPIPAEARRPASLPRPRGYHERSSRQTPSPMQGTGASTFRCSSRIIPAPSTYDLCLCCR
ncbi:unnamed protein product [Eruca vesicaria subsp. sativa]|uniref:Uncharacterized protein n=1 Tax=Eruca vesicaria subsp. sativa TaxID=29727 RepID=A0ABC8KYU6_ERUVS|nr:unnamed protein product [Eruca vesicaria subsp. sativa]